MESWKRCRCCGKIGDQVFNIGFWTQHCNPTEQANEFVCDECVEKHGVDPDKLAALVLDAAAQGPGTLLAV